MGRCTRVTTALLSLTFLTLGGCQNVDAGFYDADEIQVDNSRHDIEFFSFITRPDIDAPRWEITTYNASAVAPGLWFIAPYGIVDQRHNDKAYVMPAIYDSDGELIWSGIDIFDKFDTFVFKVSRVKDQDMLTLLWPQHGQGVIINDRYEVEERVNLDKGTGAGVNMHDFQVVDGGSKVLYLTAHNEKDLSVARRVGYQGGECKVAWNGIAEREIESGDLTFEWMSKDHIGMDESVMYQHDPAELCGDGVRHPQDYLHLNAIEKLQDGNYLVSGRRSDTIYKISTSGQILWRLGGRKDDFTRGPGAHWSGQHDIRCLAENSTHLTLTMMDNAHSPGWMSNTNPNSRGLVLSVNTEEMTAEAVMAYDHPDGGYAEERGNFQTLPNGNAICFWTDDALTSEHTPDGTVVKKAALRSGLKTYRGYKFEWHAQPSAPPDVHSELIALNGQLTTAVHASWNGATEVAFWNLYSCDSGGGNRNILLSTQRTGFETALLHAGFAKHIQVEAIDHAGQTLDQSKVFATLNAGGEAIEDPVLKEQLQWLAQHPGATIDDLPMNWKDEMKTWIQNPLFTFFAGVLFCFAALGSGWGVWRCTRALKERKRRRLYAAIASRGEEFADGDGGVGDKYADVGDGVFYDKDTAHREDEDEDLALDDLTHKD